MEKVLYVCFNGKTINIRVTREDSTVCGDLSFSRLLLKNKELITILKIEFKGN